MKVMTFNVQHCLDYQNQIIDIPLFADFIRDQDVDICALNEMRGIPIRRTLSATAFPVTAILRRL